jgi:hypothetical protein
MARKCSATPRAGFGSERSRALANRVAAAARFLDRATLDVQNRLLELPLAREFAALRRG